MNIPEIIDAIRHKMREEGVDALVIPSEDPHKSEYTADHWQTRRWITGFTGSAGTVVLTLKAAGLWTDFRYYIQAEAQLRGSGIQLFKSGEPTVPRYSQWLRSSLEPGATVGLDGRVFSTAGIREMQKELALGGIRLCPETRFFYSLWMDRPPMPLSRAFSLPVEFAGQSRQEKIRIIRDRIQEARATHHVIATLDDIAWIFNIRGRDVHTNPVNIAYAVISEHDAVLFIHPEKIDPPLASELKRDGVTLRPYEAVHGVLAGLKKESAVLGDPESLNYGLYRAIGPDCTFIEVPNPSLALKAVKNEVQIRHLKETMIRDGAAVVNFLFRLEQSVGRQVVTELSAAEQLFDFRQRQDHFVDNSFDPIMAYGDHSAMCHYSAAPETDVPIGRDGLFLIDTGGNYLTGTTDMTRTLCLGSPTPEEREDYTLVLKSHIAVAEAVFPSGTRGYQIDTLARGHLWRRGLDFGHGTGHGVGFFLCVHEGPARISPQPVDAKLEKGMVLTNEPGIYREGRHGVRLENMILVKDAFENSFGKFMKFDTLTLCHFETRLMDIGLLSKEEILWVNQYHQRVFEKLCPVLDPPVGTWLREKTRPLSLD